eukprot:6474414-Amphidinium_carterae.1
MRKFLGKVVSGFKLWLSLVCTCSGRSVNSRCLQNFRYSELDLGTVGGFRSSHKPATAANVRLLCENLWPLPFRLPVLRPSASRARRFSVLSAMASSELQFIWDDRKVAVGTQTILVQAGFADVA